MRENDLVQFNEKHKWCGCIGIVDKVKETKLLIGIPIPEQGTAYIFATPDEVEYCGISHFRLSSGEDDEG